MKNILVLQSIILGTGTIFTWYNLLKQIHVFLLSYGSLFKFSDCLIPNPLVTACFYGSVAMLGHLSGHSSC